MRSNKKINKIVVILLFITFYCFQLFAQNNLSARTSGSGYIVGGLGIASGMNLGLRLNSTNNSSIYLTYGEFLFEDMFNVKSKIITLGHNYFKDPEKSTSGFANISLSYLRGQSTNPGSSYDDFLISPNIGYDYLLGRVSCFMKMGFIGIVSAAAKPKTGINFEFGFAQEIW